MKRLQYIDALRGLTILLVVFHHTLSKMGPVMGLDAAVGVREVFASFRMPLFFFLSGYFAWRVAQKWTSPVVRRVLLAKFHAQILGTAVFASAFCCLFKGSAMLGTYLSNIGATEYWFTVALLQMFLVYLGLSLMLKRAPSWALPAALGALTVGVMVFHYLTPGQIWLRQGEGLATGRVLQYFPYFVGGLMVRRAGERFFSVIGNKWFTLGVTATFLVCSYFVMEIEAMHHFKLLMYVPGFTGILTLLALFYQGREYFERDTHLTRAMTFTGRHTLDIYFIHYFLLPDLAFIPLYIYTPNPVVPMLLFGFSTAAIVVTLSLGVSRVIRTSPVLASWLFGSKEKAKPAPVPTASPVYNVQVTPLQSQKGRLTPAPHRN